MKPIKVDQDFSPTIWSDLFDHTNFFNTDWVKKNFQLTTPAINVHETDGRFDLELAAPGFKKKDFKISLQDENTLVIQAEKQEESTKKGKYTRREFAYRSFSQIFDLPKTVDGGHIDAEYQDGILTIHLPKKLIEKGESKKEITVS